MKRIFLYLNLIRSTYARIYGLKMIINLYRIMVTEGRGVKSVFEPVEDDKEGE